MPKIRPKYIPPIEREKREELEAESAEFMLANQIVFIGITLNDIEWHGNDGIGVFLQQPIGNAQ